MAVGLRASISFPRFAGLLDKDIDRAADIASVHLRADFSLKRQQLAVAAALDIIGNIIGEAVDRNRARPRRILEDEIVLEPHRSQKVSG